MSIQLLLTDVDGVMTDGGVTCLTVGDGAADTQHVSQSLTFNIRDGLGIKLWQLAGFELGIVTGRKTEMVAQRSADLGIEIVEQGAIFKLPVVEKIAQAKGIPLEQIAYVGDDLPDLPVIRAVGLGVAVADAADEVKAGADLVLQTPGGRGALRELIEKLLKDAGKWGDVLAAF